MCKKFCDPAKPNSCAVTKKVDRKMEGEGGNIMVYSNLLKYARASFTFPRHRALCHPCEVFPNDTHHSLFPEPCKSLQRFADNPNYRSVNTAIVFPLKIRILSHILAQFLV